MKYRQLGKSGLKVSALGLGSWLTYGKAVEDKTAEDCIHKAYELGINFFDTANAYEAGKAEVVLGNALKDYERSSYVVATKVFFPMGSGPNDRGLSRKHIIEQCDASLKRLGLDYIDLYQCHRFDPSVPVEETLLALDDLVKQGKVLYTGVSEWTAAQIQSAVDIGKDYRLHPIISNQPIYNMIERYIEDEVLPVSNQLGLGQIVFSPLAQGVLTGKYKPDASLPDDSRAANDDTNMVINSYMRNDVLQTVQKLNDVAKELEVSLTQLSLAWILRQQGVSSAIIGASRPGQIEENVKAVDIELSEDTLQKMEIILEEIKDFHPAR
ncbi:aldo/keto reductase family protein [Aquibacillus koreensis]|uniref:Aldo/keto reductase family protein n=1 Tax=Aquibacillus koreensis TaxID=279446 RepID=A0A9X4AGN0_9BACI|nr:aldo/keto reductase family protein [Aquibacillus koreensis]MCT2537201.1 aldo/keto reductase family protein [Aquibacillus koreensis]MDC3419227.1 aldo/keto reductase family protein [Aquibacillus koreensis]